MSDELEVSAVYVRCQGRDHVESFVGKEWVAVVDDGSLPREWDRGESPYGPWVKVPREQIERHFGRRCSAVWDGQRVGVVRVDDPLVLVVWAGGPESWARAHDLQGSQYDGWEGWAPIDELTDIRVDEVDVQ